MNGNVWNQEKQINKEELLMKKKKFYTLAMTGALSFGLLGASLPAMAAPISTEASEKGIESLDEETKAKVQTIIDELQTELAELGVNCLSEAEKWTNSPA